LRVECGAALEVGERERDGKDVHVEALRAPRRKAGAHKGDVDGDKDRDAVSATPQQRLWEAMEDVAKEDGTTASMRPVKRDERFEDGRNH
jgi:hypothetical protein